MATEAEAGGSDLTKVDSAIGGVSPVEEKKMGHRRTSSSVTGVYNINDLGMLSPYFITMSGMDAHIREQRRRAKSSRSPRRRRS